jgi:hypothetical protein
MSARSSVELRADSRLSCMMWHLAITTQIEDLRAVPAHPDTSTLPSSTGSTADEWNQPLLRVVKLPGNEMCADCGAYKPRWASVTHQVLICVECAGVHRFDGFSFSPGALAVETLRLRNLGRHVSFVQGVYNDSWSEENIASFTSSPGNELLNSATLEYHVPESVLKPNPRSSFEDKEKYITAKCVLADAFFPTRYVLPPLTHVLLDTKIKSVVPHHRSLLESLPHKSPLSFRRLFTQVQPTSRLSLLSSASQVDPGKLVLVEFITLVCYG